MNHNENLPVYGKREFYYGITRISEREFLEKRQKIIGGNPQRNSWSVGIFIINDWLIHYYLTYVILPLVGMTTDVKIRKMPNFFPRLGNEGVISREIRPFVKSRKK